MKKNFGKISVLLLLISVLLIPITKDTFSYKINNSELTLTEIEYTDEYQEWLELSDEEKAECIAPAMYDVEDSSVEVINPLKLAKMGETSYETRFSLEDIISENIVTESQKSTGACWAFASLTSLETNLALSDYYNGYEAKYYDFSERHMEYATSSVFSDATNKNGFNRKVGSGGDYSFARVYLTNGTGAIPEEEMPFTGSESLISISSIQGKTVSSRVYDAVRFPTRTPSSITEDEIDKIKNHIKNYGGIMTGVYIGSSSTNYSTGAVYGTTSYSNHAITIIGWDDNYSTSNFKRGYRPSSKGAWIAKNSWSSNPILYISYYDRMVYDHLFGIEKATSKLNYDNIYQYDHFGYSRQFSWSSNKVYLANVFERDTDEIEYLSEVSIYAPETYEVNLYVNPSGNSKSKSDLQQVMFKTGTTAIIDSGYRTLEILNPVALSGDSFTVVLEIQTAGSTTKIASEAKDSYYYKYVTIENDKCFYGGEDAFLGTGEWYDFADEKSVDSTIKAFTVSKLTDTSIKNISITNAPTKTIYLEGTNFDKTGMKVVVNFNNGESRVLTDYDITNGTDLKSGQTSVVISYAGKTVSQAITVINSNSATMSIKTPPTKTEYKTGDNFDASGMEIVVTYNGTQFDVTDYEILNGANLKKGQTSVTISYGSKTVNQAVSVEPSELEKIEITTAPNKTKYVENQDFDPTGMVITATFDDGRKVKVTDYTVADGKSLKLEQTTVTISYEGQFTTQEITVEEKIISSISVKKLPTKTTYVINKDSLDLADGIISVTYSDGTTGEVSMTTDKVTASGFSNSKLGKVTITLTYQSKTTTFEVEIVEAGKPVNSNFSSSVVKVNGVSAYYFSDSSKNSYTVMNLNVNNLSRATDNDSLEYYYYLSSNQGEENISNWVKVTENQTANDKLSFTINSSDVDNYSDISNASNLYLYIKEVAIKGGDQKVTISNSMEVVSGVVITYLDGVEQGKITGSDNVSENPQTGNSSFLIVVMILIFSLFASIYYYKRNDLMVN